MDWDIAVILLIGIALVIVFGITVSAAEDYRATKYIDLCVTEGSTKNACTIMRWMEIKEGSYQQQRTCVCPHPQ